MQVLVVKSKKWSDSIRDICIDIDDTDYNNNRHRDQEYVYVGLSERYGAVSQSKSDECSDCTELESDWMPSHLISSHIICNKIWQQSRSLHILLLFLLFTYLLIPHPLFLFFFNVVFSDLIAWFTYTYFVFFTYLSIYSRLRDFILWLKIILFITRGNYFLCF